MNITLNSNKTNKQIDDRLKRFQYNKIQMYAIHYAIWITHQRKQQQQHHWHHCYYLNLIESISFALNFK